MIEYIENRLKVWKKLLQVNERNLEVYFDGDCRRILIEESIRLGAIIEELEFILRSE